MTFFEKMKKHIFFKFFLFEFFLLILSVNRILSLANSVTDNDFYFAFCCIKLPICIFLFKLLC
jgi:hypothetical protein